MEMCPHRRLNALTNEWILVSPHRTQRPWQGHRETDAKDRRPPYDPNCYLCPGNERAGHVKNPDYRSTFVFDNDFAALQPNGRDWLLWPPKANYFDARNYAEAALARAPADAVLLADPVLASPMQYLQRIDNMRPDVVIRFCCWDIEEILISRTGRPIVLADVWPAIYPIERLLKDYEIEPASPIYLLNPHHG